ncbi:MAG TPA: hypothetical protein VKV29_00485 [Chthonomonas sp.]|uniref:hypothetical protein n=1 Tax=Chthonomonas sp. TaxID=2282153 RepID=UPI002B4B4527|nr:hypothetical protein [Chthonomonas sp.]HLH78740.1 hypothetical protein [Chthonomonas sp.]
MNPILPTWTRAAGPPSAEMSKLKKDSEACKWTNNMMTSFLPGAVRLTDLCESGKQHPHPAL